MVIEQYDVYLVSLDPALGHEIKKSRPCLVISPNEMNYSIQTVLIAPMTTKSRNYPTRIGVKFRGKSGWVVLDQIRAVDQVRLVKRLGSIENNTIRKVKSVLQEMLVDSASN